MPHNEVNILVIGSINMDLVNVTAYAPEVGETIIAKDFQMIPGGKGMNQAVAAARMGAQVAFAGRVGDDLYGEDLKLRFERESIDSRHVARDGSVSTGLAFINVTEAGENTIVLHSGANGKVSHSDIDAAADSIRNADLVIFQLEIPVETVIYGIDLCKRMNAPVLLNPAPFAVLPDEMLDGLDYVVLNEIEGRQMTGIASEEPEAIIRALKNKGVKQVILTMGSEGVWFNEDESISHLPAQTVEVVDTTAAGDTFIGSFAVFRMEGHTVREASQKGIDAASKAIAKMGAQSSIPRRDEI